MRVISYFAIAALHGKAFVTAEDACSDETQATCHQTQDEYVEDREVASMMQLKRHESEGRSDDEASATDTEELISEDEDEHEELSDDEEELADDDEAEDEDSMQQDGDKSRSEAEKCCSCSSGYSYFSRSGSCDKCHGSVNKMRSVVKKCRVSNEHFKGDAWCNQKCESGMRLHWPQTREKCCKCEDGRISYSMEGDCNEHCHGKVQKQRNVVGKCKGESHEFKGESWCHAKCQDKMKSWLDFGTTEKCCKCKDGVIGWSANGDCHFCFGSVDKKKNVPRKCRRTNDNFKGEHWCNEKCEHKLKGK